MGVRVTPLGSRSTFVLTAAHCIKPPDLNETDQLSSVALGPLRGKQSDHEAFLVAWEGCGDIAVLQEIDVPEQPSALLAAEGLPDLNGTLSMLTVDLEWVQVALFGEDSTPSRLRGSVVSAPSVRKGTSGSPLLDDELRVHALLSSSVAGRPMIKVTDVRGALPSWVRR